MKVNISAVIITLNEERNIGRCLESLVGVVDEIVVVDSYSSDRTREICESYNARVIGHLFKGHIEQKNWAVLQASSPYILSLDADEVLSDELRDSILAAKENWTHDGYYFNRLTNYCGQWIRHTSWYPSRKLRLWDARKGSWGGFNPHDKFFLNKGSSRNFLKGDILHYSYYSVSEHLEQMNSFSSILARSYYDRGKRALLINIVLHPIWRFFKDYILKRGFLDGYYGFVVSSNSAYEVFMKYIKLRNIYRDEKRSQKRIVCFFNTQQHWGGGEKWHFDVISHLDPRVFSSICISSSGSTLSRKLEELDVKSFDIKITNLSFFNPWKVLRLATIFRRERVGVLVTNLSADMKAASLAAKLAGVPRIIYRRGSAIPVRNTILNRYLFRRVLTHVIANSQETRRTILANNSKLLPKNKIRVIYNGVYLPRYNNEIPALYQREEDEIVLGCAGRLSEEKGHFYLLEMMSQLKKSGVKYKLLLAGEGKLLHTLQRKARKMGLTRRINFLGFVDNMPSFFNSIDIFLLPSQYEGFGYVLAESMASRKPVVAFDIKSSSEIVEHGETGYVTPPNDVGEMTKRVLELSGDEALRKLMGEKGRERVEDLFSFEQNLKEILRLLDVHAQL